MSEEKELSLSAQLNSKPFLKEIGRYYNHNESLALLVQRTAMTEIKKNPALLECDGSSILGAILQSAQIGLSLDSNLQHAALVSYFDKKSGKKKCQFQPMYKGILKLVYRANDLLHASAYVIKDQDEWEFSIVNGEQKSLFRPKLSDRGQLKGVFSVLEFKNGSRIITPMGKDEIDKCRLSSKTSYIWDAHLDEMAKKTVMKRSCKYLNMDEGLSRAITLDDLAEEGIDQGNEFFDGECEPVIEKKSKTALVTEMLKEKSCED